MTRVLLAAVLGLLLATIAGCALIVVRGELHLTGNWQTSQPEKR